MGQTKLEECLINWKNNGGDLKEQLYSLEENEYNVISEREAEFIISLIDEIDLKKDTFVSENIYAIATLFPQVQTKEVYQFLHDNGIIKLIELYDKIKSDEDIDKTTMLFLLKIFAMYESDDGAERVIDAVKSNIESDSYMWSMIFNQYREGHMYAKKILEELKDIIPDKFAGIAFLDFVNAIAINQGIEEHPFNSSKGYIKLKGWLSSDNEEEYSYAHSSAAALPFIDEPNRTELLNVAINHKSMDVKMEAAWAMVKSGKNEGLDFLIEVSKDVRYSTQAIAYIKELGYENKLFEIEVEEDFYEKAEMCNWLSHPNEFGFPPDEIEVYDKRRIFWPPTNDERDLFLFKYKYEYSNDSGIGMVGGSSTFALFGENFTYLTPEEVYGLHCCWELEMNGDTRAPLERNSENGIKILKEYNKEF